MPLPQVHGWIIDYRTASVIYGSQSNQRIDHCTELCQANMLYISHIEESLFKKEPTLRAAFITPISRIIEPDEVIFERCLDIANRPNGKEILEGNQIAVFLTATASTRGFGIISDHRNGVFCTVHDLCRYYGLPVYTSDDYFRQI